MRRLMWLLLIVGAGAVAAAGLYVHGDRRWSETIQALTERLEAGRTDGSAAVPYPTRFDSRELHGLPDPVQRYFRAVLSEGQPMITAVTLDVSGTFNMKFGGSDWKPFTSRQRVVTRRPGFIWDAQMPAFAGVPVRVVDSYIAGQGLLHAAVLGLFAVADFRGTGEIARGELIRYFAEAAWYPTALLPSQGVRWEAVDGASAKATIVDGPITLTLLFRFNDAGLITSVRAEERGGAVGNDTVMMPWEGSWSDYQLRDRMMVPMAGEAAWLPSGRREAYFKGTVTSTHYEFAP